MALEFRHVTRTFGTSGEKIVTAVEDIDFKVNEGEFVAVVGPSGCGKSTILSMTAGLYQPTSGEVLVSGEVVTKSNPHVGFMLRHAESVAQIEHIMRMYVENVYAQDGDRPIGAFDPALLQIAADFYVANELVTAAVPVEDAYTNDFIE